MSIERTFQCDAAECNHHHVTRYEKSGQFLTLYEPGDYGAVTELHFCGWDCVLQFAAKIEPSETSGTLDALPGEWVAYKRAKRLLDRYAPETEQTS